MMQAYCRKCVQPGTRPGIFFDAEGVCSACLGHAEKERLIDWAARRKSLEVLLDRFRRSNGPHEYDCIVPVSGGKDSTYQVHVLKELYGMHPLCVTYKTPLRTELGQRNLDNLQKRLKVDLIELTVSPETERKFILKAIHKAGDCSLPFHQGMFAFVLRSAVNFNIPLVVWGESPSLEYGGTDLERRNYYLDSAWLAKHGCLQGKTAMDWVDGDLTAEEMRPFMVPTEAELKAKGIQSIFLGQFLRWDPVENARIAMGLGFQARKEGPVMGIYDFADVDCKFIVAHHYVKWLKFGMTRTFDNVSIEIRNGRMTREEAVRRIRENRDDPVPREHLEAMLAFLGITEADWLAAIEPYRNHDIWKRDTDGTWRIPGYIAPW